MDLDLSHLAQPFGPSFMVHVLHRGLLDVGEGLVDDVLAIAGIQEGGDLHHEGLQTPLLRAIWQHFAQWLVSICKVMGFALLGSIVTFLRKPTWMPRWLRQQAQRQVAWPKEGATLEG